MFTITLIVDVKNLSVSILAGNHLSNFLSHNFCFRELQDQSNRVDVISVTSLRTVTAGDAQRSTTPRLLKVGLTEDLFLINLSQ